MDSSKVGKCRIACCSCLSRGKGTQRKTNTHSTISSHWKNAPSTTTFNGNVSFSSAFVMEAGNNHCIHTQSALKAWWWISRLSLLVCLIIAPISVQASAVWSRGINKNINTILSYDKDLSAFWIKLGTTHQIKGKKRVSSFIAVVWF